MSLFDAIWISRARPRLDLWLFSKVVVKFGGYEPIAESRLIVPVSRRLRRVTILLLILASLLMFNCWSEKTQIRGFREPPVASFQSGTGSGLIQLVVAAQPTEQNSNRQAPNSNNLVIDLTIVDKIQATTKTAINDEPMRNNQQNYRQSGTKTSKTNAQTTTSTTASPQIQPTIANANKPKLTIETAVFLDHALSSRYASMSQGLADLNKLVLTIMNQVKYMFSYKSLMESIDIKLVLIESFKDSERRNLMSYLPNPEQGDIDLYLANFCQWQKDRLDRAIAREALWWDHAILLSGLDLYKAPQSGSINNVNLNNGPQVNQTGVLGLSWVGGMCKGNYSCTIGEALHLESAFVITHEIGHSLGMMHDGNRNSCDPNKFIMSDKTGAGKVNWSRCSNHYLAEALKRQQLLCLTNQASVSGFTDPMYELTKLKAPGQVYSLNEQCKLAYGNNYSRFISQDAPYNNVCQELWCVSGSWARPVHPALEGSSCDRNQGSTLTCHEGKCV